MKSEVGKVTRWSIASQDLYPVCLTFSSKFLLLYDAALKTDKKEWHNIFKMHSNFLRNLSISVYFF